MKRSFLGNVVRGGLIGLIETVPGVSGGTVALVVGIYDELINSIGQVVSAARRLLAGPDRVRGFKSELAQVHWKLVSAVAIGMFTALLTVAGPMSHLVENYPQEMRAVFFGLVLGSIWVPLSLAGGRWQLRHGAALVIVAAATFWLLSIPPTEVEATPLTIVGAAAIAVSALMLPGLSGSFLLLTMGMYQVTLKAVAERDLGYIGLFAVGAALGMIVIVKGLQWLLHNHHKITMVALVGLMIGALRTLWPWQDDQRNLLVPEQNWPLLLALAVAGVIVVSVTLYLDRRVTARGGGMERELAGVNPAGGARGTDPTRQD